MTVSLPVTVTAADRLNNSIIITFSDGRCGVYSSALLYSMLASARELHEAEPTEMENVGVMEG